MLWAIFGLTNQIPCQPEDVYQYAAPATFNRYARVFWQHMIFDMLVHISDFSGDQPPKIISNASGLKQIAQMKGMSPVSQS